MELNLIKQPYEVSLSGNPMPFTFSITPFSSVEAQQDVRLQIRVMIEMGFGTNQFLEVRAQNLAPDTEGRITFDASNIVDAYLNFYTPKRTQEQPKQAAEQRRRFKIQYYLQVNNAIVGAVEDSDVFYAIKGGLAYQHWHPVDFFTQYILAQKKPLMFSVPDERIRKNETKFLFWLYPFDDNAIQTVTAKLTLENGTIATYTIGTVIAGKWGVCCVPVALNQFAFASLGYVVSYTISVSTATAEIVAPVTYLVDAANAYDQHLLLYRTSLGSLDSVPLRGQVDFEADYERQSAQRTNPPAYFENLNLLPATIQTNVEETAKFKADTGFVSLKKLEKLRELFLSKEVYHITAEKFIPAVVLSKSTKFYSNKEALVSAAIEWQHAFVNEFFTPEGALPTDRPCPAVEKFLVKQITRNKLQIMYALQTPYDRIEVQILIGSNTYTYRYTGNTNTIVQTFTNPVSGGGAPQNITVKARTICNEDTTPPSVGPVTQIIISVTGNSLPVANDDNYAIAAGYNSYITLSPSALANDYDPDGDPIEAVAASGATTASGAYTINAAGIITYLPPASTYIGKDGFNYQIREVGASVTVTAKVNITVGEAPAGIFAKMVIRNQVISNNPYESYGDGERWIDFFKDPAGTQPLDVTSLGLSIDVKQNHRYKPFGQTESSDDTTVTYSPTGTKIKIYEGMFWANIYDPYLEDEQYEYYNHEILPGAGFTII